MAMSIEERRATKAAYQREWSARNLDRARELRRQSRDRTIEKRRAHDRAYYQRTRDQRLAASRAWRLANPERDRAMHQAWKDANREKMRGYRRDWMNELPTRASAVHAAAGANQRAELYGCDGRLGYENIIDLWRRQPVCVRCGDGRGVDHVIPLSKGGPNTTGNLQNLCRSCNSRKGARMPKEAAA